MSGYNTLYGPGNQPKTFGSQDENLDNFVDNWPHYHDRLMVFLGAGSSMGAVCQSGEPLPTAVGLRDELWHKFMLTEQERANPPKLALLSLEQSTALIEAAKLAAGRWSITSANDSESQHSLASCRAAILAPKAV